MGSKIQGMLGSESNFSLGLKADKADGSLSISVCWVFFFYLHYKKLIPSGPKKLNLRQGVKSCTDEVRNSPCSEAMQERLGTGTQKERNKARVQNRYMQHQHINVIS